MDRIKYKSLTETEKKVYDIIYKYVKNNEKVSIGTVAKKGFVSVATVVKLCKKMGYTGYKEMYYHLLTKETKNIISIDFNDFKGLVTVSNTIDLKIIAEILYVYRNSINIVSSCGYCDSARDYLLQRLWSFGFRAINSYHKEALEINSIRKGAYFVFSQSGEVDFLLERCEYALNNGYNLIIITSNISSPLAQMAHLTINVESNREGSIYKYKANLFTAKIIAFIELLFEEYSKLVY